MKSGWLNVRGLRYDGHLSALLVLYETRKLFGARTAERFLPAIALFELAYLRFLEREARDEAVRTLEDVTQRVHGEYETRLGRAGDRDSRNTSSAPDCRATRRACSLSSASWRARTRTRVARLKRAEAVDATVASAVEQLEKAHVELHRRSEAVRQKTRTIYLIDKVLTARRLDR